MKKKDLFQKVFFTITFAGSIGFIIIVFEKTEDVFTSIISPFIFVALMFSLKKIIDVS